MRRDRTKMDNDKPWLRIPDGTMVLHRSDNKPAIIDGLTELVDSGSMNPDGRTQYRLDVGSSVRRLAGEDELLIVVDENGLVVMPKQSLGYRQYVTARLHHVFEDNRFIIRTMDRPKDRRNLILPPP